MRKPAGSTGHEPFDAAETRSWRARFPITRRGAYLANHTLGAMPASVPGALSEYARLWGALGVEAWPAAWLPLVQDTANLVGSLMGAPGGSVVLDQNVATLTAIVLSAVDVSGERNRVVLTDREWPSHRYLVAAQRDRGLQLDIVPADGVEVDADRVVAAIDRRTALVVCSHITFYSGARCDVAAIAERARSVGALSLVDGYHAVGHMPVDVSSIGCDFYVGGSVKWLCGGPGVGYLYVRPGLDGVEPRQVGWLGHARPFAFEPAWEPAPGAMGWLGGTPSIPAIYAAREGYRAIAEATPARIRAASEALTRRLVEGALERGIALRTPLDPARRGGMVVLDVPGRSPGGSEEAVAVLAADGVTVDHRPQAGIRVGPHFFNTADECDRVLSVLAALR
jgi:kynureninase